MSSTHNSLFPHSFSGQTNYLADSMMKGWTENSCLCVCAWARAHTLLIVCVTSVNCILRNCYMELLCMCELSGIEK